ncbi:TIGR02611 family protein [Dermatophilaceae bacterium Sec6.4]
MSTPVKNHEGSREATPARWAWQRKIRANPTAYFIYRIFIAVFGLAIVVGGIILLPLPGPGWVIIFVGLGVWASEFAWASRLLRFAKDKVRSWTRWLGKQNILIRGLVSLAVVALVLGCIYGYLLWQGVPTWLPSFVTTPLVRLPGL